MQDFFNTVPMVVWRPWSFANLNSEYFCYDARGGQVAAIQEMEQDAGSQLLRAFGPLSGNNAQRRKVVLDAWQRARLYIYKEWSIGSGATSILAPDGAVLGMVEQQFTLFKPEFHLKDAHHRLWGVVKGNFTGHEFQIFDHQQHEVCRVNRNFGEIGQAFQTAESYVVWQRYLDLPEPLRTLVLASAVSIDLMVAKG